MKSRIILLVMIVLSAMLQFACLGSVTGPDDPTKPPPPPFEEKRYTLKVEYIRVDVKRPDLMGKVVSTTIYDNNLGKWVFSDQMVKEDDYHYEKQFSGILETESYNSCYYIYGIDPARVEGDGLDGNQIVGEIFILTTFREDNSVISTLKLINILQNNLSSNPVKGPNARMAKFCIQRNGTLTND